LGSRGMIRHSRQRQQHARELRRSQSAPRPPSIPGLLDGITALRDLGVRIALDDVGLGQSNYRMMLDCHPEYFKLDAYFVRGLTGDPKRRAVVESVATLAKALGSSVVAEGVELNQDLALLGRMGIELVQANLLCPALPLEDLVAEGLVPGAMDMSSPSPARALGNPSPHAFELDAAKPFAVAARSLSYQSVGSLFPYRKWPTQARFWLEMGCSDLPRHSKFRVLYEI
jgi:hypothetical protein